MVHYSTMPSVGRMAVMATSFLGMANAHLFLAEPKPLAGYSPKDPLDASGSNFPCHGAPLPTSGGQKMTAGESFPLKFDMGGENHPNTAVHGGGSCQLALLYDTTKGADPSAWEVITSIEGDCPATAKGNLLPGYNVCTTPGQEECMHEFDIKLPKEVKSGNAILSWTWFNKIGNREMYQNCVNVDIQGGSGDGKFPPLYVANLESVNSIKTQEGVDPVFPDPGQYVIKGSDGVSGGSPAPSSSAPSYSAPASSSAPAYSATSSAPAYSAPAATGIASYDNQKGRQTATTFATSASAAAPSSAAPSSAAPAPTGYSSGSSGSSNSSSDGIQCSEDGALVCIGSDSFGICDHGRAVSRPLAKGTVCKDGVIGGASRFRRHVHSPHKH